MRDAAIRGGTAEGGSALDLAHLRDQTFGDPDLEREVLSLFLGQAPALLRAIGEGPHRADAAHKLLGSARGIGAVAVAAAAADAERVLLADPATPDPGLGRLQRALDDVEAAILSLPGGGTAGKHSAR